MLIPAWGVIAIITAYIVITIVISLILMEISLKVGMLQKSMTHFLGFCEKLCNVTADMNDRVKAVEEKGAESDGSVG